MHILPDFIAATERVNRVLTDLAELGLEKQQLIIANEIKELDNLIRKEGTIVSNLTKAEGVRFKLQEGLAASWGMSVADLSAANLIERLQAKDQELAGKIAEVINTLEYNLTRLKAINKHNDELIEQALEYIDNLQVLYEGDVAGTYSSQGEKSDEAPSRPTLNLLDKRV